MFIILSLITLVASFNIFATVTVKVVEKTKDIGVLKSLGFTSGKIRSIFSLQGLLLGLIGVSAGTLLGTGLCLALMRYPFIRLPEEIYALEYLPVAFSYRDTAAVVALADEYEVERFVVGLPINMDATEGPQAKLTRTFAGELEKLAARPVDLHDERLSSWAADRAFDEAQLTRKQRSTRRDAVAAQIILQGYLDAIE